MNTNCSHDHSRLKKFPKIYAITDPLTLCLHHLLTTSECAKLAKTETG